MSSIEIPKFSQKKVLSTLVDGMLIPTPEGIKVYEKGEWKLPPEGIKVYEKGEWKLPPEGIKVYEKGEWKLVVKPEKWDYEKELMVFLGNGPRRNKKEEK